MTYRPESMWFEPEPCGKINYGKINIDGLLAIIAEDQLMIPNSVSTVASSPTYSITIAPEQTYFLMLPLFVQLQ